MSKIKSNRGKCIKEEEERIRRHTQDREHGNTFNFFHIISCLFDSVEQKQNSNSDSLPGLYLRP